MTRHTSIIAYHKVENSGILSAKRLEIYKLVFDFGPCTSAEAHDKQPVYIKSKVLTQSRARFTELREMGAIEEVGEKACNITGHKAIVWDVTGLMPNKFKRVSKEDQKDKKIKELELKIAQLELHNQKQLCLHY